MAIAPISRIIATAADLAGKADVWHTHQQSQVTGLSGTLAMKVAKSGTASTLWCGTQTQYDALAVSTKNSSGFVAVIIEG